MSRYGMVKGNQKPTTTVYIYETRKSMYPIPYAVMTKNIEVVVVVVVGRGVKCF